MWSYWIQYCWELFEKYKRWLNSNPNGFKYETLTTDANIRKSVDDIVYGAYGEDNPHPLEWYSSNNTKAAISPEQYLSEERNKIMRE